MILKVGAPNLVCIAQEHFSNFVSVCKNYLVILESVSAEILAIIGIMFSPHNLRLWRHVIKANS